MKFWEAHIFLAKRKKINNIDKFDEIEKIFIYIAIN